MIRPENGPAAERSHHESGHGWSVERTRRSVVRMSGMGRDLVRELDPWLTDGDR